MTEIVNPGVLITVVGSLLVCLGTVLWFFFQRLYRQIDKIIDRMDGFKTFMHEVEIRLGSKIDDLDKSHDKTRDDVGKLFTRVGTLEGFIHGAHGKQEGGQ